MKLIYLSQRFSENTYLVAGKCSRCYQETQDVQIVGINRTFLKLHPVRNCLDKFDFNEDFFVYLDNDFEMKIRFIPPKSPYNLIEEQLYDDPWKVLVATIFLNKTSLKYSKNHLEWFLNDFKTPCKLLQTDISALEKYFEPLGLHRTRSKQVYLMTHDYLFKNWRNVEELFGVGEYGRDAYNMFCLGNFDVEPKDRYLRIYKDWYQKVYLQNDDEFAEHFYKATSQGDKFEIDLF